MVSQLRYEKRTMSYEGLIFILVTVYGLLFTVYRLRFTVYCLRLTAYCLAVSELQPSTLSLRYSLYRPERSVLLATTLEVSILEELHESESHGMHESTDHT